jgi:hypothetical protein
MIPLTLKTEQLIDRLFTCTIVKQISHILQHECGDNLPFCENSSPETIERLRFAVLKIADGKEHDFLQAIELAKIDWRDLLMCAGFAVDISEHERWADDVLSTSTM